MKHLWDSLGSCCCCCLLLLFTAFIHYHQREVHPRQWTCTSAFRLIGIDSKPCEVPYSKRQTMRRIPIDAPLSCCRCLVFSLTIKRVGLWLIMFCFRFSEPVEARTKLQVIQSVHVRETKILNFESWLSFGLRTYCVVPNQSWFVVFG